MSHIRISIKLDPNYHEFLIADLFDMDFDGFEEDNEILHATIEASRFDDVSREQLEGILTGYDDAHITGEELIEPRNWNEQWEQSIQPQRVGNFWIHPTWSVQEKPENGLIELVIDPKLAFGTGYHATTQLMLESMHTLVKGGEKVLDAGCGTGILAIAALKLGASEAFGFDIDEWSRTNAEENMLLNDITTLEVILGSTEVIPEGETYDLILANINRDALLGMLPELLKKLKKGGYMLLSGLLDTDEEKMRDKVSELGELSILEIKQKLEWISILLVYESSH